MDRQKLLADAVTWAGCRYQLADALGIPRQSVYQWRLGVPRRHVDKLDLLMRRPWVPAHDTMPTLRKPLQTQRKPAGATK